MIESRITKNRFDLEDRTFSFAKNIALFCKTLPRTVSNIEYQKQVIRSSGSVGANYIEANEALSRKDFLLRIKICRKEAKETSYWLRLIMAANNDFDTQQTVALIQESRELRSIFSAIVSKST